MASDLLDRMRRNPVGDWNIRDVETLCREHGLLFRSARGHTLTQSILRHGNC
jgi:hypothetical protein